MVTTPPSPAISTFVGLRLNTSAWPKPPSGLPRWVPPKPCAASKITGMPARRPSSSSSSGRHDAPNTWVPTSSDAPSRRLAASSTSIWQVSARHSVKRGTAPAHMAAWAVAENVKLGIATALPGLARACMTSIRPAVHEDTAMAWGTPSFSAAASSNCRRRPLLVSAPLW